MTSPAGVFVILELAKNYVLVTPPSLGSSPHPQASRPALAIHRGAQRRHRFEAEHLQ